MSVLTNRAYVHLTEKLFKENPKVSSFVIGKDSIELSYQEEQHEHQLIFDLTQRQMNYYDEAKELEIEDVDYNNHEKIFDAIPDKAIRKWVEETYHVVMDVTIKNPEFCRNHQIRVRYTRSLNDPFIKPRKYLLDYVSGSSDFKTSYPFEHYVIDDKSIIDYEIEDKILRVSFSSITKIYTINLFNRTLEGKINKVFESREYLKECTYGNKGTLRIVKDFDLHEEYMHYYAWFEEHNALLKSIYSRTDTVEHNNKKNINVYYFQQEGEL